MKKLLFTLCFLVGITIVRGQNVRIMATNGTTLVGTGVTFNMAGFYSGSVANPCRFTLSPTASYVDTFAGGTINIYGPFWFDGTGAVKVYDFATHNHYLSYTPSPLSIYHTATVNTGDTMDFNIGTPTTNPGTWLRTDLPGPGHSTINAVINGITYDYIMGLKTYSTATTGPCPSYTPTLSVNVSGAAVKYQWQSSVDSSAWSTLTGQTNATYTPTVTVTRYYRCVLTSIYSATTGWLNNTPGLKHLIATPPAAIGGTLSVCMGNTRTLTNTITGGTWTSGDIAIATIGSSSGIVSPVTTGTVTMTYSTGCAPDVTAIVTVNPLPTISGGSDVTICRGTNTLLTATGGTTYTWAPSATLSASTGTSVTATPTVTTTYTVTGTTTGCSSTAIVQVSVNSVAAITGTLTVATGGNTTLSSTTSGGVWSSVSTGVGTIGSLSGIVTGLTAGTTVISYAAIGCVATATVTVTGPSPVYYSSTLGGDASVLTNWWSNNNNTGSQPLTFSTTGTTWIFQSNMTSTAPLTIAGNVSIVTGISFTPLAGSTTTVGGNWSNTGGTFNHNGGTVLFDGSNGVSADTISGGVGGLTGANKFNNITFNSPSASYTFLGNAADVNGVFLQSAGAVTAPSANLNVGGDFTHNGGSFAPNGGTVTMTGGSSTMTVTGMTTATTNCLHNLTFNAASAATYSILSDLRLTGNFTGANANGTMDLGSNTLTIGGNWSNLGPFTVGAGHHIVYDHTGPITATGNQ